MSKTLLAAVLLMSVVLPLGGAELSETDRRRLGSHLEMTGSWLIDEVSGLSQAQLDFRPAPGTWSILEVLDHLVVVGPIYWNDLRKAIDTPRAARSPPAVMPTFSGTASIGRIARKPSSQNWRQASCAMCRPG